MTDQQRATEYGYLPILAERARYADRVGVCALCQNRITPKMRIATLSDGRGDCHVTCFANHTQGEPK